MQNIRRQWNARLCNIAEGEGGRPTLGGSEGVRERWIFHRLQLQDGRRLRLIVYSYCERARRVRARFITLLALLSASTGLSGDHTRVIRLPITPFNIYKTIHTISENLFDSRPAQSISSLCCYRIKYYKHNCTTLRRFN